MTAAYQQAHALIELGRHAQAEATLRTALIEAPGDAELLTLLAFTLRRQGKPVAALETCEAALAADPQRAEAHVEHAEALLALLRYDDALAAAEQAVRLAPTWSPSHQIKAQALVLERRYPEARAAAEHALSLDPHSVPALVMAAHVARLAGRHDDAERTVRAALEIDPENYDARWELAMIDADRLRTRRSVGMLRGLARERPAEPNAMAMIWPVRHQSQTLKRWLGRATLLILTVAFIADSWAPAMLPSRILAAIAAVATVGCSLLLLAPAGLTPWRGLWLVSPLTRRAAYAGMVTAGGQVALLIAYAATGAWWLALLAVAAAPVLWLLDAAMTLGAGLTDPGGRVALQEVFDDLRQWWVDTRKELRSAWQEDGRPKP